MTRSMAARLSTSSSSKERIAWRGLARQFLLQRGQHLLEMLPKKARGINYVPGTFAT